MGNQDVLNFSKLKRRLDPELSQQHLITIPVCQWRFLFAWRSWLKWKSCQRCASKSEYQWYFIEMLMIFFSNICNCVVSEIEKKKQIFTSALRQSYFFCTTKLLFLCIRFFKDCSIRLMDVDKDVRRSYQELIKALPTDLLTRFVTSLCPALRI